MIRPWIALLAGLLLASPVSARPCGDADAPCAVAGGTYLAREPETKPADGRMPLLLFLHGYRGSAAAILADPAVGPAASRAGMLIVAPEGLHATWSHVGAPSQARDDIEFLRAVVRDAKRRWPVDPNLVIASGFSQGGSMVWDLACRGAEGFTAFLPIAGAFWEPLPASCPAGPVNLRHVHGLADTVVPMEGRAIRTVFRQGDVMRGIAIRRAVNGCAAMPDRTNRTHSLTCTTWSSCAAGTLELCLHDGGHDMDADWLTEGLAWARALVKR